MDTHPIDATATALIDAFAQFQRSIIDQAESLVTAWRAALQEIMPQCFDANGNMLDNWEDILANPLDPPRG